MTDSSGLTFRLDATKGETRFLNVQIEIEPPFTKSKLELKFPRWVPGSYFIREPMQYLTDINCIQGETNLKFVRRFDVFCSKAQLGRQISTMGILEKFD